MLHSPIFWEIVNWASMPALAVLIGLLMWRNALREFPYFCYYIIVGALVGILRLSVYDRYSLGYFYVYWITDVLIAITAFLATYELFVQRLFLRFRAFRFYRYLFPAAMAAIVVLAIMAAPQLKQYSLAIRAVHVLDVLRVAMLLFLVTLMVFMGRDWGRYELGI